VLQSQMKTPIKMKDLAQ